jgi:hypothetical protein
MDIAPSSVFEEAGLLPTVKGMMVYLLTASKL